jgi:hypothetical protein
MSAGENLIVHITLPKGMKLTDGSFLSTDVTFDVVSTLSPYYASVDQVRLEVGGFIRYISDLTVAASIYAASREVDQLCQLIPNQSDVRYHRFVQARNNWVTYTAALNLLLNTMIHTGKQSHVLSNFSVTKDINPDQKIKDLQAAIAKYEAPVRSCGATVPGGKVRPQMAAKGANDWMERPPSRLWIVTGAAANGTSYPGAAVGGKGRSFKFYSPPIISYRIGIFSGGMYVTLT